MTTERQLSKYYGDSEWGRSAKVSHVNDAMCNFFYVTQYQDNKVVRKITATTEHAAEGLAEDWTIANPIVVKGED